MIYRNKTYLIAMLFLGLMSCSSQDVDSVIGKATDVITMSASIDEMSSRSATNILTDRFAVNNRIAVYIKEQTADVPSMVYTQPIEYRIISTAGVMAPTVGKDPFYPVNGNNVEINAFFPYVAAIAGGTYTLGTTQLTKSDYEACDLMVASFTGRDNNSPINLSFKHIASRIVFNLSTSQSNVKLNYSKVSLLNVKREANIDASTGSIYSVSGGTESPVLISNNGAVSGSAIILPQSFPANTRFIEIELASKEKVYGIMPNAFLFESGKTYIFNIDVVVDRVASTLTLNDIQIVDWVNETAQEIEGERTN